MDPLWIAWTTAGLLYLLGLIPVALTLNPTQASWWRWFVMLSWPIAILWFSVATTADVVVLGWKTLQRIRRGPSTPKPQQPWRPPVRRHRR